MMIGIVILVKEVSFRQMGPTPSPETHLVSVFKCRANGAVSVERRRPTYYDTRG